jgi:hypothetical protein
VGAPHIVEREHGDGYMEFASVQAEGEVFEAGRHLSEMIDDVSAQVELPQREVAAPAMKSAVAARRWGSPAERPHNTTVPWLRNMRKVRPNSGPATESNTTSAPLGTELHIPEVHPNRFDGYSNVARSHPGRRHRHDIDDVGTADASHDCSRIFSDTPLLPSPR